MSLPIVHFKSAPPLMLNCKTPTQVALEVRPGLVGKCKVVLSCHHDQCTFDNSEAMLSFSIEASANDDLILCEIPVRMKVELRDLYFVQITAHAVNSEDQKSIPKHMEAEVDGLAVHDPNTAAGEEVAAILVRHLNNDDDDDDDADIHVEIDIDVHVNPSADPENPIS